MTRDVIVVGSGASGCVAALILANAGSRVTLLESAPAVAPLLRGFRRSGLLCETGFHYTGGLDDRGFLRHLFERLGIMRRLTAVAMPDDGFDVLHGWGRRITVPVGLDRTEDAIASAFSGSRGAIRDYFATLARILRDTPFLNPDVPPWEMRRLPEDDISLQEFLVDRGAERDLVATLGTYGRLLYGMKASEVSLRIHAAVLGSYFRSAHAVQGGGEAIATALDAALLEAGVQVRCGSAVKKIDVDAERRVTGAVLEDGEYVTGRTVIFTPHPARLGPMLVDGAVQADYRNRLEHLESTPAVFATFLRCTGRAAPNECNHYFMDLREASEPDLPECLAFMAATPEPGGRSPVRTVIEPATPEDLRVSLACAGRDRSPGYLAWKARRTAEARARALRLIPDLGAEIEVVEAVTPVSYFDWTGTMDGSAYGAKRAIHAVPLRTRTPVRGLFLAGQGLLTPGVMGAAASGVVAAGRVAGLQAAWELMAIR
jgi:all-trans-retinol 13,14-reductase